MYSARRRLRVRSAAFWIISSWIGATAAGLTIAGVAEGGVAGGHHAVPRGGTLAGLSAAHPLLGGQPVSVTDAARVVGFDVPLPDASIANQGNLTATWAVAARQQVALIFDQGKLTIMMQPADYQDPAGEYQAFIPENNAKAAIGDVGGQPALVISPNTDYYQSNPAWVEFDLNGTDINVVSASYSTDQLLEVADSVAQAASWSSPSPSPSSSSPSP